MKRFLSLCLMSGIFLSPLHAKTSADLNWAAAAQKVYQKYSQLGVEAYLSNLEKSMGQKFLANDRSFLIKTLGSAFRQTPPAVPGITAQGEQLEIKADGKTLLLSLHFGEENTWMINGKKLDVNNRSSVQDITRAAWKLLAFEYKLGPFPEENSHAFYRSFDFLLPQAHAGAGLVLGILVAVAVIGSVVYFTNKTVRATQKAIKQVGDSTSRGIDRVSGSAASAIDKIGDSAAKVGDSASHLLNTASDKAAAVGDSTVKAIDSATEVIQSHNE